LRNKSPLSPVNLVFIINVSENRRGNPEWTIQGSRTLSTLGTQDKYVCV
jgi:hypothetical protein